mmetsp:Transcript_51649/g.123063  ORF Transcript_51649/g.123063 Transcript_51649/m.123063 type:complete len:255 (-) Transcript_51649:50-814(-)
MEVLHVILVDIRGGDVRPAAEPRDSALRLEVAVVEVHGRAVGVPRVHHRGEPAREEGHLLARRISLGAVGRAELEAVVSSSKGLLRHAAVDHRERAARLLKHVPASHNHRDAATAALAHPRVRLELALPIDLLDLFGDVQLRLAAHLLETRAHLGVRGPRAAEHVRGLVHRDVAVPSDAGALLLLLGGDHVEVGSAEPRAPRGRGRASPGSAQRGGLAGHGEADPGRHEGRARGDRGGEEGGAERHVRWADHIW